MFRDPKKKGRWIAIAVAIGLVCSAAAVAKKPPKPPADDGAGYDLVVLAPDVQMTGSYAYDLDEAGNVVGTYSDSDGERNGFYYDRAQESYLVFGPGVVVTSGSWSSGNALAFLLIGSTSSGGLLTDSYDGSTSDCCQLHIEYQDSGILGW